MINPFHNYVQGKSDSLSNKRLVLVETIPEKRKTVSTSPDEETDPNTLRDREIKRLAELSSLAYKNCTNKNLAMRIRENWHKRYTNHVLALNVLLKDSQLKDYEERMKIIEEHEKKRGAR